MNCYRWLYKQISVQTTSVQALARTQQAVTPWVGTSVPHRHIYYQTLWRTFRREQAFFSLATNQQTSVYICRSMFEETSLASNLHMVSADILRNISHTNVLFSNMYKCRKYCILFIHWSSQYRVVWILMRTGRLNVGFRLLQYISQCSWCYQQVTQMTRTSLQRDCSSCRWFNLFSRCTPKGLNIEDWGFLYVFRNPWRRPQHKFKLVLHNIIPHSSLQQYIHALYVVLHKSSLPESTGPGDP